MTPKTFIPISDLISLKGRNAIVTGGARGIGFAICYRFAEAGASVIMADVDDEAIEKACQQLGDYGYQVMPLHCDVSNEDDVITMVTTAANKMGGVNILVNNAGVFPTIQLEQMTVSDMDRIIDVNIKGVFLCCREASKRMLEQKKGGCIINLASIDAVHPSTSGLSAYDASKGAVLTATKSLALELGQHDIRVNAIAPGAILTEGAVSAMRGQPADKGRARMKIFMSRMTMGRMGEADDIARVALFLASDLASYITGTVIFVDGGYLIS